MNTIDMYNNFKFDSIYHYINANQVKSLNKIVYNILNEVLFIYTKTFSVHNFYSYQSK